MGNPDDAYWIEDGVWGAGNLTRGTYSGINGSTYEQYTGRSTTVGPNGEVAFRAAWKYPVGTTEVKAYPSVLKGAKPGYQNNSITPAGAAVQLPDGTQSQVAPSGATPGTTFPIQLPLPPLYSSFRYTHTTAPTGRGHLSYDIWLQNTPVQQHGWNSANEITDEIMIPLTYWGDYGSNGTRNPAWYSHDAVIDGYLWHIYFVPRNTGPWQWNFTVFEPDSADAIKPGTLDLSKFINYTMNRGWTSSANYCVSVELGVEPVEGTGDLVVDNYRVWK